MADRFKYSEVRQKIIDAIRTDLIGPREAEEVLEENHHLVVMVDCMSLVLCEQVYLLLDHLGNLLQLL